LAYVAALSAGLRVVSIADPAHPIEVGSLATPGAALSVKVAGNLAYVGDMGSFLHVVNVADPAHPAEVTSYATPSAVLGIALAGDLIYAAAANGGVVILRLRQPGPPPPSTLVNGDFEGGFYLLQGQSIANGWAPFTLAGNPSFAGERSTVHNGRWAYKISGYAPFTAGLAQVVSVQPGKTYQVTTFYQLYPPGDGQAFLGVQDGALLQQLVGDSWPGVWRPLSQTITPTTDRLLITLLGNHGAAPNTNVYFDDVTVTAVGAP
jgi:hypothetical protein